MAGALDDISAIRELFHGRWTDQEIATLYDHQNRDKLATVNFLLNESSEEIARVLQADNDNWEQVVSRCRRIKASDVVQLAREGRIRTDVRQFGCLRCDHVWWRRIPHRKPVSKCNRCKVRYDALPKNKEWGWGQYECQCGRNFQGFGAMECYTICFNCHEPLTPTRIIPPDEQRRQRKSRNTHFCLAPNCIGYQHNGHYLQTDPRYLGLRVECVHPMTRRSCHLPAVVNPSNRHDSTGSTVDTFLPQRNLNQAIWFEPVLMTINDDEDDRDDDGNDYGGVD